MVSTVDVIDVSSEIISNFEMERSSISTTKKGIYNNLNLFYDRHKLMNYV
jgi:hypothetical protein